MTGTVLVLARDFDAHVDRLVDELGARQAPVFRTDLAAFPQRLRLTATLEESGWSGHLENDVRAVDLDDITAIWYRDPSHFAVSEQMSRPEQRHAAAEARVAIAGILGSLDVRWMNHPAQEAAAVKPRQLDVARRCGLTVPRTVVSNGELGVRGFVEKVGGPVAGKDLSGAGLVESNRLTTAFTRRLTDADLTDLRGVETTAHLFQEFIDDKTYEVRATVVGEHVFAAAIHARSEAARIDFRADYDAHVYTVVAPPEDVRAGMLRFMRAFGLSFGAFDFAVTDNGWYFFECNPCGAYGWLEQELALPITETIADFLVKG